MEVKRRYEECPQRTREACKRAFGKFWGDRCRNGEGCDNPVDDLAEAYAQAAASAPVRRPLPTRPAVQREFKLTGLVEQYRKGLKK